MNTQLTPRDQALAFVSQHADQRPGMVAKLLDNLKTKCEAQPSLYRRFVKTVEDHQLTKVTTLAEMRVLKAGVEGWGGT